jgi:hypothetical protein
MVSRDNVGRAVSAEMVSKPVRHRARGVADWKADKLTDLNRITIVSTCAQLALYATKLYLSTIRTTLHALMYNWERINSKKGCHSHLAGTRIHLVAFEDTELQQRHQTKMPIHFL